MPLIIAPAGLKPMWQRVNESFNLGAEVISHSIITSAPDAEFDEELGHYIDAENIRSRNHSGARVPPTAARS